MGPDAMILVFWMLNFKPTFLVSSPPHVEPKYLWFFIGTKSTGMTIALIHSNFGIEDSENEGISFPHSSPCPAWILSMELRSP